MCVLVKLMVLKAVLGDAYQRQWGRSRRNMGIGGARDGTVEF